MTPFSSSSKLLLLSSPHQPWLLPSPLQHRWSPLRKMPYRPVRSVQPPATEIMPSPSPLSPLIFSPLTPPPRSATLSATSDQRCHHLRLPSTHANQWPASSPVILNVVAPASPPPASRISLPLFSPIIHLPKLITGIHMMI
ncbi:uncharacterized protein LOC107879649 [Capsicum annuum]|uniref:uncharacterized protein LOC107879649 n=1 Tax=Capsicum annuum TaxID=4072 RepID=UPI0007BEE61F|nr:uncharacterized protein LOC107879649 [Capsicum annuum]